MLGMLELGSGTREHRERVDQVGRRVDAAADFAVVAVLVFRVALGAFALDVAVGQEHVLFGVEELLDGLALYQRAACFLRQVAQVAVDLARQLVVLRGVGAVPVVKADVEAVQVLLAPGCNVGHKLLRRLAGLLGGNHDGRAMGVVRAYEVHRMALHALEAHPDIGLDVFHDVADVEVAVGVGQGGGDEELTVCGHEGLWLSETDGDFSLGVELADSQAGIGPRLGSFARAVWAY